MLTKKGGDRQGEQGNGQKGGERRRKKVLGRRPGKGGKFGKKGGGKPPLPKDPQAR